MAEGGKQEGDRARWRVWLLSSHGNDRAAATGLAATQCHPRSTPQPTHKAPLVGRRIT